VTSLLWLISGAVLLLLWRSYFPGYLQEKGKNLALREDIEAITRKIEEVKDVYSTRIKALEHQNAVLLEQLRGQHQLRLAAVDRRLAAHQEAFALWRQLIRAVHSEDIVKVVIECQDWWEKNCLYLSAQARDSFNMTYTAAHSHRQLTENRLDAESVSRSWDRITKAGDDIVSGADLPPLKERESQISEAA
jgi:hypothetical protein